VARLLRVLRVDRGEVPLLKSTQALHVIALLFMGCATTGTGQGTSADAPLTAARLFPMIQGAVWSYHIDTGTALPALGILRVVGATGQTASLAPDGGQETHYERVPEGIRIAGTDEWVLHEPIAVGTEWTGRGARRARIAEMDVAIELPAGEFTRCVKVEEIGAENRIDQSTVYCPDVGPVIVESTTTTELTHAFVRVRAELLGYAAPE
jgi:hypothetical protein